jgi:hypothetical protein
MEWLNTFKKIEAAYSKAFKEDFPYVVSIFPDGSWVVGDNNDYIVWGWGTVDALDEQLRQWAKEQLDISV